MKYRRLGRTGIYVSELCFGSMTFAGKGFWKTIGAQTQADADRLVGMSLDAGINFFDTADVYAEGESERTLGKALGARRKDVIVATKVRGRTGKGVNDIGLSRVHVMRGVEESLERLGTDYVDLYQIHSFDPVTPLEETLRALDDLVGEGKVRYLGASNVAAWQLMKALALSERDGLARFETLQAFYAVAARDLERELVPLLRDQQVGLLVWSPLAGGLLTGKFERDRPGPAGARRSEFDFPRVDKARAFDVVDALAPIAQAHDATVARAALAWLLHQGVTTSVIVGARTAEQLADDLLATDLRFTEDELKRIDEVSALPPEYPGWMLQWTFRDRVPE